MEIGLTVLYRDRSDIQNATQYQFVSYSMPASNLKRKHLGKIRPMPFVGAALQQYHTAVPYTRADGFSVTS